MNIIHTAEVDRGYFSIRELHGVYYLHMKAPLQKEQCITLTKAQIFTLLMDLMKLNKDELGTAGMDAVKVLKNGPARDSK